MALEKLGIKLKKRLAIPKRFQSDDLIAEECADAIEISSGEVDSSANQ